MQFYLQWRDGKWGKHKIFFLFLYIDNLFYMLLKMHKLATLLPGHPIVLGSNKLCKPVCKCIDHVLFEGYHYRAIHAMF